VGELARWWWRRDRGRETAWRAPLSKSRR